MGIAAGQFMLPSSCGCAHTFQSRFIPTVSTWREATFAGFFGPIGEQYSALLPGQHLMLQASGPCFILKWPSKSFPTMVRAIVSEREVHVWHKDAPKLTRISVITPVNYFLVLTSIIIHGITIPIGKGFHTVRTKTLTSASQASPNRFSSSETKGPNIRSFLPFTHLPGARQPTVAFADETTQAHGDTATLGDRQSDSTQPSSATFPEHRTSSDLAVADADSADQGSVDHTHNPITTTWKEGDQVVVERDGRVVEVKHSQ